MKKCPLCAEEIQDAAIKCRHCGSMLVPSPGASPDPRFTSEGAFPSADVPAPMPGQARTSYLALSVIGIMLLVIAALLLRQSIGPPAADSSRAAVSGAAASLVPSAPTDGEYQFLDLPWNLPRAEVRARLEARGFTFLERDADGDDAYEGRVDGRDAGLAVRFAGDALSRVSVILIPADSTGSVLMLTRQTLADAYGPPKEQRDVATIWPERAGTLLWLTATEDRHVTAHFESAGWPAESRRRRGE